LRQVSHRERKNCHETLWCHRTLPTVLHAKLLVSAQSHPLQLYISFNCKNLSSCGVLFNCKSFAVVKFDQRREVL
jgi:hypothetical protein